MERSAISPGAPLRIPLAPLDHFPWESESNQWYNDQRKKDCF
jgi:hypothetical protein